MRPPGVSRVATRSTLPPPRAPDDAAPEETMPPPPDHQSDRGQAARFPERGRTRAEKLPAPNSTGKAGGRRYGWKMVDAPRGRRRAHGGLHREDAKVAMKQPMEDGDVLDSRTGPHAADLNRRKRRERRMFQPGHSLGDVSGALGRSEGREQRKERK